MQHAYVRAGLWACSALILFLAAVAYAAVCAYVYLAPSLPDVNSLRDVRLQVPLGIYSRDGRLIAQIGEYRRKPVSYEDIPPRLIHAVLATEDDRFFAHSGVDYISMLRATANYVVYGQDSQAGGGGTITMQLARNIFFKPRFTYQRKLSEIFLAFRIEGSFTKREILTLYMNKIFLGQRAYGVAAAAEVYFGKSLDELTLAETATVAGLPQAPSRDNPIANPERAKQRRAYVLRRMHETGQIDEAEYHAALEAPIAARLHGPVTEIEAPYVAEMARAEAFQRFGEEVYTSGYKVITTIDSRMQQAADGALRAGLIEYDRRRGYRGPLGQIEVNAAELASSRQTAIGKLGAALAQYPTINALEPAVVVQVDEQTARLAGQDGAELTMDWLGMAWARRTVQGGVGPAPKTAAEVLAVGDVVYVIRTADSVQLAQLPVAQSALVAVDPRDGAIVALNGGFDYFVSKYNRAVQARRQPGSAFKPFIYSAALENGFTPASVVLDAPVVFDDAANEDNWRPENYSGQFYGPTRLREALVKSRNLVSVRLMRAMGIDNTMDYLTSHFGFAPEMLPRDLTLALGSLQLTPVELATQFATFANGGFRVQSYLIDRIEDADGRAVYQAQPAVVCANCEPAENTPGNGLAMLPDPHSAGFLEAADAIRDSRAMNPAHIAPRAISAQNAWLLTDMMRDVILRGTARRARALGRNDLAGKTGTTNDQHDAWFCGFNANLVATAWVGLDQAATLGPGEEGGRTALPVWVHFMREALRGMPESRQRMPDGLVTVRISPLTGKLASADDPTAIFETFMEGHLPEAPDPLEREKKKDDPLF